MMQTASPWTMSKDTSLNACTAASPVLLGTGRVPVARVTLPTRRQTQLDPETDPIPRARGVTGDSFFSDDQRGLQNRFDSRNLAGALRSITVQSSLDEAAIGFIESRAFFFLSTVNHEGHPTVSYKGGAPGFVRAVGPGTIVFPCYEGNGMFLSMGNIVGDGRIGVLSMDFERPHRVRVHAQAEVLADDPRQGRGRGRHHLGRGVQRQDPQEPGLTLRGVALGDEVAVRP
jgi:hypothetical protein